MIPSADDLVLPTDPPEKISRAIEDNAVAGVEAWARWPGLELHNEQGLTYIISDIPFFIFNNVLRCAASEETVDASIDQILADAKSKGVSLAWWLTSLSRPENLGQRLARKGFINITDLPAMAVDLNELQESVSAPSGLTIDKVTDDQSLAAWSHVICEVNEFPDFVADAWLSIYRQLGLGEDLPWAHFLARLGGEPVAACSVYLGIGVAGLHSVSTLERVRRQGIGTAITVEALKYGQDAGYRMGTLFSSEMAVEIYRKLGFQEYFQGHLYLWSGENVER